MKGNGLMSALVLILALTMACESENQGGPEAGGGGVGYARMYDPKTVETVNGKVVSVDKISDRGMGSGVSLTLKAGMSISGVIGGPHCGDGQRQQRLEESLHAFL